MKKKMSKEEKIADIWERKADEEYYYKIIKIGLGLIVLTFVLGIILAVVLIYGSYK